MSFYLLLLIICPLAMFFMMRGMGGMGGPRGGNDDMSGHHGPPYPEHIDAPVDPRDARLAELEREVADLRAARDRHREVVPARAVAAAAPSGGAARRQPQPASR